MLEQKKLLPQRKVQKKTKILFCSFISFVNREIVFDLVKVEFDFLNFLTFNFAKSCILGG